MSVTMRIIKTTDFDTNGTKGSIHTVSYKGRALNVNTLSFEDTDLTVDAKAKELKFNCKIEASRTTYVSEGLEKKGFELMPVFDLDIV